MQIILYVLDKVALVIAGVAIAAAALFVLRVVVAWVGSNPFGWLAYNLRRVTEPVVRPIRQPFSGYYMRFDLLPLVAAAMILFIGLFVSDVLWRLVEITGQLYLYSTSSGLILRRLILLLGLSYEVAIFTRVVLPWFGVGYGSKTLRFLFKITEPLLRPIRRMLSRALSMSIFDFTPIIALVLVRIATGILAQLVSDGR